MTRQWIKKMRKATLSIEYAILITIVVAALIAMSGYIKRAVSGRWRGAADTIGYGRQYEPGVTKCYDANGHEIPCS